jgi:hypothetical protein
LEKLGNCYLASWRRTVRSSNRATASTSALSAKKPISDSPCGGWPKNEPSSTPPASNVARRPVVTTRCDALAEEGLGFGVRVSDSGRVTEIIVAQLPEEAVVS